MRTIIKYFYKAYTFLYCNILRLVSGRKLITVAGGTGHLKKQITKKGKLGLSIDLFPVGATDLVPFAIQGLSVTKAVSRENFNTGPIMMNY